MRQQDDIYYPYFLNFLGFLMPNYLTRKQRNKRKYVPAKPDMWRKAPMSLF